MALVDPGSLTDAEPGGKVLVTERRSAYPRATLSAETDSVASMSANDEKEIAKGRIPLWLDPDDLRFLACEFSRLPDDTPEEITRLWMRIAVRAHAALQKSGHGPLPFGPYGDVTSTK
jgi:hypothetical protein